MNSGLNIPSQTTIWVEDISFICNYRGATSLLAVRVVQLFAETQPLHHD